MAASLYQSGHGVDSRRAQHLKGAEWSSSQRRAKAKDRRQPVRRWTTAAAAVRVTAARMPRRAAAVGCHRPWLDHSSTSECCQVMMADGHEGGGGSYGQRRTTAAAIGFSLHACRRGLLLRLLRLLYLLRLLLGDGWEVAVLGKVDGSSSSGCDGRRRTSHRARTHRASCCSCSGYCDFRLKPSILCGAGRLAVKVGAVRGSGGSSGELQQRRRLKKDEDEDDDD